MKIGGLLIANRGEIAVRIIRAAKKLGIRSIQAHSSADADSLAVQLADEAVEIGPPVATKSYLNTSAILDAAKATGADAIHPGYGFLSENADFVDEVEKAGLIFVGPTAETIRTMGDKATARATASASGVPIVPGSDGVVKDLSEARAVAEEIGFPVMIKATAGGGGRGIRVAHSSDEFESLAPQAAAEAQSAFGDGGLYLERAIQRARHIEVQILGDGANVVHCFERECSLQRRRQKVWEEAPSAALPSETREQLCASAVALASSVKYRGAGTIEYLFDDQSGEFFFIEMNTRIQVEHPVTECIVGIDLVAEMIRIAGGEPLSIRQPDISARGHSIEVRINAEDPANGFLPFPGLVSNLRTPNGEGVRFDHMLYDGYRVPPFYDSLLGKLIVWADTRQDAIERLKSAVSGFGADGLKTTAPLFIALANDSEVIAGNVHTKWLEPWIEVNADKLASGQGGARQ